MSLPPSWQWKLDRWRERVAALFRAEPREGRPRLCPACGTLVGSTATKCHECGTSLSFSLAAASRSLAGILPEGIGVTHLLLGANGLLFLMSLVLSLRQTGEVSLFGGVSGEVLLRLGAKFTPLIKQGELWRLVVPVFLHGGLFHIFMNTMVLMDLGPQLEEIYGRARFFFLYVLMGAASFAASAVWSPLSTSVGASGALMGMIGLMLAITTRRSGVLVQMYRRQLIRWVIYIGIFGLLMPGIDNAAHLGGMAAGYGLGRIFDDREPATKEERTRAYAMGWAAAAVVIASFAAMLVQYFRAA